MVNACQNTFKASCGNGFAIHIDRIGDNQGLGLPKHQPHGFANFPRGGPTRGQCKINRFFKVVPQGALPGIWRRWVGLIDKKKPVVLQEPECICHQARIFIDGSNPQLFFAGNHQRQAFLIRISGNGPFEKNKPNQNIDKKHG
ncbi:hypothetical protein [Desulfosarcina sp.]|uniref:hypothetical protein n=1 Tax=Desulfosarcina sp. TaxID=2027861 RepID=UPI003970A635